ncbi:response regulator [Silvanigrella paludirubra]|uniref:Response regulator n=1 Tax=Silvanigrella paludirubra TaxID=2499159 RepID=A0A6N6VVR6_9BACT|nr:response regulator [Silvanigrella paludirubra]KAB8040670.1 response regulator [Silvanigrella paludirubra]
MTNISLLDKEKCAIVILETITPMQNIYISSFIDLDYKLTTPFTELNDIIKHIKDTHVDWCLLSLDHLINVNLLDLFDNLFKSSKNQSLLISIISKENENLNTILSLFEIGLFSNFIKPSSLDDFEEQLKKILEQVDLLKGNYTLVCSNFIRELLKNNKMFKELLQFEKSVLEFFPGSSRCLIHLAEAECLNKNFSSAVKTIAQAKFIDPESEKLSNIIYDKYLKNLKEISNNANQNILGIENCIIIDPDSDVQFYVCETLKKLGVNEYQSIMDGEDAYKYLSKNKEPDLIIMEWKIPKLSGVALVQRIRKLGFNRCFIVIISSLVKATEHPLLQELGIEAVIEKPFDGAKLSKELIGVTQRARKPLEQGPLERKIRILLASKKFNDAKKSLMEYMQRPQISKVSKLQMQAEFEYGTGNYGVASNHALSVLKSTGGSVLLFSLLGKCFIKLKDFKTALKCFEKAHELSPTNMDRILTLVDLKQESGKVAEAKSLLDDAKKIDPTNTEVIETDYRIAIKNSENQKASQILKNLNSLTGVIGLINNDAVARIRSGNFEDGIKLYKNALESLTEDLNDYKGLITYNLALAHARNKDLKSALETLNSIEIKSNTKIYKKFKSFKVKVKMASLSGGQIDSLDNFNENKETEEAQSSKSSSDDNDEKKGTSIYENILNDIEKKSEVKKGSRCCYKIYNRVDKNL